MREDNGQQHRDVADASMTRQGFADSQNESMWS